MKQFLLLFLSVVSISFARAQAPSEKLFNKYGDKDGVDLSVISRPPVKVEKLNTTASTVVKVMTVENNIDEKAKAKLFKQVTKDCIKLLNRKDYKIIQQEKDEDEMFKMCSYTKNGLVEILIFEKDEDELTLTSTLTTRLTEKEIQNFKVESKN